MKDKLLRIGGALLVSGLLYGGTTLLHAQNDDLPITPPITPPTETATPTPTLTVSPSPTVTPTLTPTPTVTPTLTPTPTPLNSEGKTNGGVKAQVGGVMVKLNFNAQGGSKLKGGVMYSNDSGDNFKGDVNVCYNQLGKEAAFAGTVKSGTYSQKYFLVEVKDNGQGRHSTPDALRVQMFDSMPTCTLSHVYPAQVTNGNLIVH